MIPDDILDVAAVVLGEEQAPLTGWQRQCAVAAMTALSYSGTHIRWALQATASDISKVAIRLGISLHHVDQRHDELAVQWVCTGATMRLRGADAKEAIRRMAAAGCHPDKIAHRIRSDTDYVRVTARRCRIPLNEDRPQAWWNGAARPSATRNYHKKGPVAA